MKKNWESIMFDDIGIKIQKVAKAIVRYEIFLSIIAGIVMFLYAFTDFEFLWYLIFLAPLAVLLGCIAAWLSVIILYGFGVLIEDTHALRMNNATVLKSIDVKLEFLARPVIREAEEKVRREQAQAHTQKTAERPQPTAQAIDQTANDAAPAKIKHEINETTWICGKCKTKNMAIRTDCWSCGTPKQLEDE